ncbi:MAG: hypothetical protein V3V28_02890 [Polaribacter sp.]|uniref:hypothetical protein n=1 Tax=Polaribacter sp. TaxID=1920175 RepID=UPI002F3519A4
MKKLLIIIFCIGFIFTSCKKGNKKKEDKYQVKEKKSKKVTEELKLGKTITLSAFTNIELISPTQKTKYKRNLQIIPNKLTNNKPPESFFNNRTISNGTKISDTIKIKIAVANKNFKFKSATNIMKINGRGLKAIAIHITDSSTNKSCGKPITHILEVSIPVDQIKPHVINNEKIILSKGDKLNVIVINDEPSSFSTYSSKVFGALESHILKLGGMNYGCDDFSKMRLNIIKLLNDPKEKSLHEEYKEILIALANPKEGGGGVIVGWP